MEKKLLSDTAFIILLLTIFSFAGANFYEVGYCKYFSIPPEYISVELNKYSILLFLFLAAFYTVSLIIDSIVGHFSFFGSIKNKYLRFGTLILFTGATLFILKDSIKYLSLQETITLLIAIAFGITLIANNKRPDTDFDIIEPKYSINVFISKKVGNVLGPILIISSFICILLFCLGYYSGKNQTHFFALPDNKTVLLKKYDNNIIYGILNNGKMTQIFIKENITQIDTLHIVHLKQ